MFIKKNIAWTSALLTFATAPVLAGAKLDLGDGKSAEIGGSVRAEISSVDGGAPDGESNSMNFNIHSARIYLKATLSDFLSFNVQTEKDGEKGVALIDAAAKFKLGKSVQIWAGRFIPPSDRANLSGSYNLPVWDYPGKVSMYPNIKAGRDDGIAIIGTPLSGKLVYALGVFEGVTGETNPSDNPIVSGRLAYSFWDAEGYLTRSTYYGKKDVLTIAYTFANQPESLASTSGDTDFVAQNVDFLLEKNLGSAGVGTLEAALYNYNKNGGLDSSRQGEASMVSASYLLPAQIGVGKVQLTYRYQQFEPENSAFDSSTRSDVGITYVIDGHNTRVGFYLGNDETGSVKTDFIKVGLQVKI